MKWLDYPKNKPKQQDVLFVYKGVDGNEVRLGCYDFKLNGFKRGGDTSLYTEKSVKVSSSRLSPC